MTDAAHTSIDAVYSSEDLEITKVLGVARALVGQVYLREVYDRALVALESAFPGTAWLFLDQVAGRTYTSPTKGPLPVPETEAFPTDDMWVGDQFFLAVQTQPGYAAPRGDTVHEIVRVIQASIDGARAVESLRQENQRDALTQTYNRRAILELLEREHARAVRYNRPLSVLFLDVDHFKAINDELGHSMGDAALVEVARRLTEALRECDAVGRFGGDELVAVLPDTPLMAANRVVERVMACVSGEAVRLGASEVFLSVSVGAADARETSLDELVSLADQRMYEQRAQARKPRGPVRRNPVAPRPARPLFVDSSAQIVCAD